MTSDEAFTVQFNLSGSVQLQFAAHGLKLLVPQSILHLLVLAGKLSFKGGALAGET